MENTKSLHVSAVCVSSCLSFQFMFLSLLRVVSFVVHFLFYFVLLCSSSCFTLPVFVLFPLCVSSVSYCVLVYFNPWVPFCLGQFVVHSFVGTFCSFVLDSSFGCLDICLVLECSFRPSPAKVPKWIHYLIS